EPAPLVGVGSELAVDDAGERSGAEGKELHGQRAARLRHEAGEVVLVFFGIRREEGETDARVVVRADEAAAVFEASRAGEALRRVRRERPHAAVRIGLAGRLLRAEDDVRRLVALRRIAPRLAQTGGVGLRNADRGVDPARRI